jgi:FixJ family two-component response regulator
MKIIFASGHGDATAVLERCAPATFLQKPFETAELIVAIAALERADGP